MHALCRCWTIFEQYVGAKLGISITIILPPEGMTSFTEEMESGNIKKIKTSLTDLNVANAKASVPEDEVKVKELISSTVGFEAVNRAVGRSMQKWCGRVLKAYLSDCLQTLEDEEDEEHEDGDRKQQCRIRPQAALRTVYKLNTWSKGASKRKLKLADFKTDVEESPTNTYITSGNDASRVGSDTRQMRLSPIVTNLTSAHDQFPQEIRGFQVP